MVGTPCSHMSTRSLRDAPGPNLGALLSRDRLVRQERERGAALSGGRSFAGVDGVGAQRAERDHGVHAVHREQLLAVQVTAVGVVLGVLHEVPRERPQRLRTVRALGLIQHDDRSLVPLRGDVDRLGVVRNGQIHADPVHHARHRLHLGAQRELQLLHRAVVVLARVQHRARLVLDVREVHEVIREHLHRGSERAGEGGRLRVVRVVQRVEFKGVSWS